MNKRIVIIDGNSLINRAYYAMQRPMITKEGIYTQGIYGFLNMLQKIEKDYEPEYLTVAFDLKAPTFRHLEYDAYKAGRKSMPPELVMQMPIMKDILRAMNIEILELEGYEADDIIGTVARISESVGLEPLIITGDKDALQLVTDNTHVLITKKGITDFEIYTPEKMQERYELTPKQFIDLKGLMGDSSDNIPGIPGVGEKTGLKLLKQFGSLENLLANTEEIESKKMREKIEENAQLALMSKRLATINVNIPMDIDLEKLKLVEPNYHKLIEIYTRLEFNSFLKKLNVSEKINDKLTVNEDSKLEELSSVEFCSIDKSDDLNQLLVLENAKDVYIKIIGDASHIIEPTVDNIFLMTEDKAFDIEVKAIGIEFVIDILNKLNISFIGYDIKDDIYILMYHGLSNFNVSFDCAIAEYVIDPSRSKYQLKTIALERLHVDLGEEDVDSQQYIGKCAQVVRQLMAIESQELKEKDLEKVFLEAELPLIEVLAAMETVGISVNGEFLEAFGNDIKKKIHTLEEQIYNCAGKTFNINSPMQLGNILFEDLGLPFGKKTKRGYSTGADVLEKIRDKHPIVDLVLEYRNVTKLNSTYVEGMKPLIGKDGKIRAHFQQTVTATGRVSCTEPNLQNIPVRQELGRNLRKAFIADKDHILIGADYSQIELRVLAHLSQDDELIEAFNKGEDIHRLTASRVLGIPFDEVTPQERSKAKAVNFGVIYGMSSFGLSEELNITRKEAENYIKDYFDKHKKVKEYMDLQIANCKTKGYSETILGRKRPIHEINASAYIVRQLGERLAMNSPIQGSAADIIKCAMIKVYKSLKHKFPETKLILQVHDELILSAPKKDAEEIKALLKKDMEEAVKLDVRLEAEVNEGETWYDLK